MNYLSKMYGRKAPGPQPTVEKNPNRVSGGLRAQGVDRFTMVAEDGSQKEIPSVEYVRSLEEQLKKTRAALTVLERKQSRDSKTIEQLLAKVNSQH